MPLNGALMPWDYYQGAYHDAVQSQQLAARMQQLRTAQIRQQLLLDRARQLLPMRLQMLQAQAAARDPNSQPNQMRQALLKQQVDRARAAAGASGRGEPAPAGSAVATGSASVTPSGSNDVPANHPQIEQAVQWLKANPDDPHAPQIRARLADLGAPLTQAGPSAPSPNADDEENEVANAVEQESGADDEDGDSDTPSQPA
jgi:hypothetical protein